MSDPAPTGPENKPRSEVDLDAALVRALLTDQHPDLADQPISLVAEGWDNAIFRLGDQLCVRLPRRQVAVALVEHEQRWLPGLASRLPLPIAAPVRVGRTSSRYPWPWSICQWFPGSTALAAPPADTTAAAGVLGALLAALHRPAPADAPDNPYRGVPLAARAEATLERLARLDGHVDLDVHAIEATWQRLAETDPSDGPAVWLHGDLHPENILVHEGRLSAVIDFGDLTSGDPAADLSVAWMLFDAADRAVFRDAAGSIDDATWDRAKGWALTLAIAYLASGADTPGFARFSQGLIIRLLNDSER